MLLCQRHFAPWENDGSSTFLLRRAACSNITVAVFVRGTPAVAPRVDCRGDMRVGIRWNHDTCRALPMLHSTRY